MDTKKKELVGEFHNGGREYQPTGFPVRVNVHDFPDKELGKAIPYGIYDVAASTGWVSVGTYHRHHQKAGRRPPDHPPRLPRRVELQRRARTGRHADVNLDYCFAAP